VAPQNCKQSIGVLLYFLQFHQGHRRNSLCDLPDVTFCYSCRAFVIAAACAASASKLHSRGDGSPIVATQELTRCLSVVRAAARRSGAVPSAARSRRTDALDR
jgi:hypothetical protein